MKGLAVRDPSALRKRTNDPRLEGTARTATAEDERIVDGPSSRRYGIDGRKRGSRKRRYGSGRRDGADGGEKEFASRSQDVEQLFGIFTFPVIPRVVWWKA